jgi:hypothetical protein
VSSQQKSNCKVASQRAATKARRKIVIKDNIKMDLRKIGWDGMDWIEQAQGREEWRALVNTVMNIRAV